MDITAEISPVDQSTPYVTWEEVFVSTDKGEREVHYNLKKNDGASDLVVIGEGKSSNRISYRYTIQNSSLFLPRTKLKSRREVVDWLNSNVKDLHPPLLAVGFEVPIKKYETDFKKFKMHDQQTNKILWLGSPWKCEKSRKHYSSFIRNGVKISVHNFVYVLAEEDQRLVAYLKDLYEDTKSNKMVMVQWFHKITEVSIILPSCTQTETADREVFFSLCTQRLSIECIDGLATVLAPQQFKKYKSGPAHCQLDPYVCHKQFDNGEVKPFDITQVKGYWNQKIFQYMFTSLLSKELNSQQSNALSTEEKFNRVIPSIRPKKKQCIFTESDAFTQSAEEVDLIPVKANVKEGFPAATSLFRIDAIKYRSTQYVAVGSQIEVLSQDSGIKGCWFRALIINKHNDRVKVRYLDLTDAENEANNVEEWILSSKVAAPDKLGVRRNQRKTTRPFSRSNKSKVLKAVDVGAAVDAWWHDGWWEGIVIRKESEEKIRVYFPEEKKESVFSRDDLRQSHEWVENRWTQIKDRLELVTELISNLEAKQVVVDSYNDGKSTPKALRDSFELTRNKSRYRNLLGDSKVVVDLLKDDLLTQLKWNSRKRRRDRIIYVQKLDCNDSNSKQCPKSSGLRKYEKFFVSSPTKVNPQNCKHIGESSTSASVVPHHHKSMVMSK